MALKYPDIIQHNNTLYAIVDSEYLRGGGKVVTDLTTLYALSSKVDQLKERITRVWVVSESKYYTLTDISNVGNSNGWTVDVTNTGDETTSSILNKIGDGSKISSTYLPSYVDDVIEVITFSSLPTEGESGKIYITTDTNLTYRWGGSSYVIIGTSLALGETSSTAYRGDRGKIAYDHSQSTGNVHSLTTDEITEGTKKLITYPATSTGLYLRDNGTFGSISIGSGGYAANMYGTSTVSDVSGYKVLSYDNSTSEVEIATVINNSEVLLATYLYPDAIALTVIDAGLWSFQINSKVSSGSMTFRIKPFLRHIDGSETILHSCESDPVTVTSYDSVKMECWEPLTSCVVTDRIGVKVYGYSTGNLTVTYIEGDGRSLYMNTPMKLRHSQLRSLNEDASYQHITSTEKTNFTTAYTHSQTSGNAHNLTAADLSVPTISEMETYVQNNAGAAGSIMAPLYPTSTASDVIGYYNLSYTPQATLVEATHSISDTEVLINKFLYSTAIGVESVDAGNWLAASRCKVSNGSGDSYIRIEFFLYHTDGTTTVLFSALSNKFNNTDYENKIPQVSPQGVFTCLRSDRLGVNVYAYTSGATKTLSIEYGGGIPTYFSTPLALNHDATRNKNANSDFQHITQFERDLIYFNFL